MAKKAPRLPLFSGVQRAQFFYIAAIVALSAFLIGFNYYASSTDPAVIERDLKESHGRPNVFRIRVPGSGGGTGFLINDRAYGTVVLTNKHICDMDGDEPGVVFVLDQQNQFYRSKVRRKATLTDLCIIEPPQEFLVKYQGLALAEEGYEAADNEILFVYGHPNLRQLTASSGPFIYYSWEPGEFYPWLDVSALYVGQADIVIQPGSSGSPVLNSRGEVVGVIFAYHTQTFMAFFVPLESVRAFLNGGM